MELQKLGVEIREAILEAMIESIESEETRACATIDTDDGYFDVSTNEDDEKDCCVWHDNDKSKSSPNLERWAESIIPDWADAADEADWRHDFDSAATTRASKDAIIRRRVAYRTLADVL